jgi:DNA-binding transcriptional ArsR family regulator
MRVTFGVTTAADLLVSMAAIADPVWRTTFASGAADTKLAVLAGGRGYTREVEQFGRFGFLNLLGVLPETRSPHGPEDLVRWVRKTPAGEVHLACIGARRQQLLELAPEPDVADPIARRAVRRALASEETVIATTRWLLTTPAATVQTELAAVLEFWQRSRHSAQAERELRETLRTEIAGRPKQSRGRNGVATIRSVAGGLTYDPPGVASVLLLPAPSAHPIVVVVDDVHGHVIAYPPPVPAEPRTVLLDLATALGDDTRLTILEQLRHHDRNAAQLAAAVGVPRTTLLHHLALLRAAGLLVTFVGLNNATYYKLRRDALAELGAAAKAVFRP